MSDNELASLPNPVTTPGGTNDMTAFPDSTSVAGSDDKLTDPSGKPYISTDGDGYVLSGHDSTADDSTGDLTNYVAPGTTTNFYTVTSDGTITQYDASGSKTNP